MFAASSPVLRLTSARSSSATSSAMASAPAPSTSVHIAQRGNQLLRVSGSHFASDRFSTEFGDCFIRATCRSMASRRSALRPCGNAKCTRIGFRIIGLRFTLKRRSFTMPPMRLISAASADRSTSAVNSAS